MKQIHLLCNAHLDPVWLWSWEEGVTEALSTFRTVCDLLEEFPEFQFNHNEAILYEWVKIHDPALLERIKKWVAAGRWHIMGGWYLQPDCNMPQGESFVRNIQRGQRFFKKEFGVVPTTAINFDSFGHTKGLVQILNQAGYDSYVVYRAGKAHKIPASDFTWKGLNDSEIVVHRSDKGYNSVLGHAAEELEGYLKTYEHEPVTLFLWGVGDHGGGPSRKDLTDLRALFRAHPEYELIHSTPEAYMNKLRELKVSLPAWDEGLNPVSDGCYTSQVRVKQKHRQLENALYEAEKMASAAALTTGAPYPAEAFKEAEYDLIFSEFHDALPGSAIKRVEEETLRLLDHGLEICAREKLRSALHLSAGQPQVKPGCSTVLVYNPHPTEFDGLLEFETGMPAQNWDPIFYYPECEVNGEMVPTQCEMEDNRFAIDWRKRAVIRCKLPASSMSRIDVHFRPTEKRPTYEPLTGASYDFDNGRMQVKIDLLTGLIDELTVDGKRILGRDSLQLVAYEDSFNPWGLQRGPRRRRAFRLMTDTEATAYSALKFMTPPIRVIEDGPIRTVIEALFTMDGSNACVRYMLPKQGGEFDVEAIVNWNEKEMLLKLEATQTLQDPDFLGQIAFGAEKLYKDEEVVAQRWLALCDGQSALTVMGDGSYGASLCGERLGLTVLRSPAHSAAHCKDLRTLTETRFTPRMEQGERAFRWRFGAGDPSILNGLTARAQMANEAPYVMSFNPSGAGETPEKALLIDNPAVTVSALKRAESGEGYILRVYESDGAAQTARVTLPALGIEENISLRPYEIATFAIDPAGRRMEKTGLIELDV